MNDHSIPRRVLEEAEGNDRRRDLKTECSECGGPIEDVKDRLPRCAVCGAPAISVAASDWLDTELDMSDE